MAKIYKGKIHKISELLTMPPGTVFQPLKEDEENVKDNAYKGLPKYLAITNVSQANNKNLIQVNGLNPKNISRSRKTSVFLNKEATVNVLTGKVGEKFKNDFQEHIKSDVTPLIDHMSMTIGADPEIFVEDKKGNIIPAFDFLGSKEKPNMTIPNDSGRGLPVYWDGFQAEFQAYGNPCLAWCCDSVQYGLRKVHERAVKHNKDAKLSAKTLVEIPFEVLDKTSDEHVSFGCAPSYNAYGLKPLNLNGREIPYRSAGGHIHLGTGKLTEDKAIEIIKTLDAILGVCCVSFFEEFDSPIRREYYGLPGEYRTPPHGLEYRVLSNAWMFHPCMMHLVFDFARMIVRLGNSNLRYFWDSNDEETIEVIQTCDANRARVIMERNKRIILSLIRRAYSNQTAADMGYKAMMGGISSIIKNPTDIEGNWNIGGDKTWIKHSEALNKNWSHASSAIAKGEKV